MKRLCTLLKLLIASFIFMVSIEIVLILGRLSKLFFDTENATKKILQINLTEHLSDTGYIIVGILAIAVFLYLLYHLIRLFSAIKDFSKNQLFTEKNIKWLNSAGKAIFIVSFILIFFELSNGLHNKIFGPKSLSHYLFYLSRIAAFASIVLISFILISLGIGNFEMVDNQFQIALPFFSETYIKGFYKENIILTITLTMLFFGFFFYVLSNILKTFKADRLFTSKAIRQLNYFAILNLIVGPILYFLIHFVIMDKSSFSDIYNLFLSLILGLFVLFIVAVFKKGYNVQNENDLTI